MAEAQKALLHPQQCRETDIFQVDQVTNFCPPPYHIICYRCLMVCSHIVFPYILFGVISQRIEVQDLIFCIKHSTVLTLSALQIWR